MEIEWTGNIKNILDSCGLSNIWLYKTFQNDNWLKSKVKQTLLDKFTEERISKLQNSRKALNYRLYKDTLEYEPYLDILPDKDAITFGRFRTCNQHLSIKKGRWQNIPRDNRTCSLCRSSDLADEFQLYINLSVFK